jgi:hypothetical protein
VPRNGSGTYAAPSSSWNPGIDGQSATTTDWNALLADLAQALSLSIASDGETPTTGRIPFAYGTSVAPGSIGSPAIQITGDPTTGIYAPAAGQLGFICSGGNVLTLASAAITVPSTVTTTLNGPLAAAGNASLAGAAATLGFYGSAGATRPTLSGAKGGNAALGSLISALAALGLIVDGTSA